eukprot:6172658-Pleurochrysis_carterae.AAC.1
MLFAVLITHRLWTGQVPLSWSITQFLFAHDRATLLLLTCQVLAVCLVLQDVNGYIQCAWGDMGWVMQDGSAGKSMLHWQLGEYGGVQLPELHIIPHSDKLCVMGCIVCKFC